MNQSGDQSGEKRPLGLRIWHWGSGLTLLLILATVLLRKTFLSSRKMAEVISGELAKGGVQVSPDLAKTAARAVRDGMWEWHYRLGFVLVFWFVFRLVAGRFPFPRPKNLKDATHAVFYLVTAFMAVSGLAMYFSGSLGISDAIVDETKEIHEAGQWFFFAFVPVHLFAVVRAELKGGTSGERGIVSRMIHGGE